MDLTLTADSVRGKSWSCWCLANSETTDATVVQ